MAPIPVYTNSPVAKKPEGVTPQTAAPDASGSNKETAPAATAATTTQSSYPQAQPGAVPSLPVQTMTSQVQAPPLQATPTQPVRTQGPPAPQPGAAPTLAGATSHLPPPPKAGEKYVPPPPPTTSQAASASYPHQMAIPPPTMAYPAQQLGTATAFAPSSAYAQAPTGIVGQGGQSSLDHPPGYHQNVNAAGLDQYQSQAIARNESADRRQLDGTEEEGVWGAAKKWAAGAGEKLAAVEGEVWKRINKD
ncbi:hypothetical protein PG985_006142 [Apiospora marii]|uniref:Uncharacterized protein n=1 Tax=Apiospora marii TaxID=335849 RepID=A0ABR1S6R6_9PEZI